VDGNFALVDTSTSRASARPRPHLLMSMRARLIVVRNSQPIALSFLAGIATHHRKPSINWHAWTEPIRFINPQLHHARFSKDKTRTHEDER